MSLTASAFDFGLTIDGATGPDGYLAVIPRAAGGGSTECYTTIANSPGGCTFGAAYRSTFTTTGINDARLLDVSFSAVIGPGGPDSIVTRSIEPADLHTILVPIGFGVPFNLTYQIYADFTVTTSGIGWVNQSTINLEDPPLIAVYDANMNLLPNARVVSQSGVNYGPAADATPVPEPATWALVGLGLAVAVVRRRRNR